MMFGRVSLLVGLICTGLFWPQPLQAASKPILVHYMPWYVAKPYSGSWGWHWTMGHFNPELVDASGRRQVASWYYPLIGPYDSADPVVLEYHVLLMKLAGVDGVFVDWYGKDNFLDYGVINQRTAALFDWTRKAGLKFSIVYEDRTIQVKIDRGYIQASNAVAHAQETMLYLQNEYFGDPSYLRRNQQPVLLNFGPQFFKSTGQWGSIFSVLAATNQPAFFTLDNRASGAIGAFNWPPMWLSQSTGGVLSESSLNSYLANFQQSARFWPAHISSAFPRFHDIYAQAGVGSSYGTLEDANGDVFRSTLTRALTNNAYAVQIVTWNDFGEGTVVEPTREYGYRDLGLVQEFRRQHVEPAFSRTTNDLALALRVYNARRQYASLETVNAELDRVFTNLISGKLDLASRQLQGIEDRQPIISGLSLEGGLLQIQVGGFVPAEGLELQTTTDVASGQWAPSGVLEGSTNLPRFTVPLPPESTSRFFRVRLR